MWKRLLYIVFVPTLLAVFLVGGGCLSRESTDNMEKPAAVATVAKAGEALKSTASGEVLSLLKPLFTNGSWLVVAGILMAAFGARSSGVMLVIGGIVSVYTGMVFAQYSTLVVIVAVLALAAAGMEMYSRWKSRKDLRTHAEAEAVMAKAVATAGEDVKAAIKDQGPEAVKTVRKVFDPIREKLGI